MATDEMRNARPPVVHVAPDPNGRGGMASVVRGLLASPLSQRYAQSSITMHRTGPPSVRLAVALRGGVELLVWCASHRDGLVHIHAAVRGSLYRKALALLIARALRRPVLLHLHAGPGDIDDFSRGLGPMRRSLLTHALRRAQIVVSVSAASSAALASAFSLDRVGVIANAAPRSAADIPPPTGHAILFLGGFEDPAKGGADLVSMLPALRSASPEVRVSLAGPGQPPDRGRTLADAGVRWLGWLDEDAKRRALREHGIVVLPSRSEGLPVVLLEAMAHGRAVVATRVGGIPDLVTDGVDGVLVAPGDAEAFVRATTSLIGDEARVRRLGAAARDRVAAMDENEIVDRIDHAYRWLLTR